MTRTSMLQLAADTLRRVENWPKEGITFFDISPLLRNYHLMEYLSGRIADHWRNERIDLVAAFDARGFIIGSMVAQKLGVGMEMIRKAGKLPGPTEQQTYDLEYGSATLEMINDGHAYGKRFLLIDDVLATGGTAQAGAELVQAMHGTVVGLSALIELPTLGGRGRLYNLPVHSLISIVDNTPVVGAEYCVDLFVRDCTSGEVLLIKRLNHPTGFAMPGGHIEHGESALVTGARELREETGCNAISMHYLGVLSGLTRDPRGVKISIVMGCTAHTGHARPEANKTELVRIPNLGALPPDGEFALEHGPMVRAIMAQLELQAAE